MGSENLCTQSLRPAVSAESQVASNSSFEEACALKAARTQSLGTQSLRPAVSAESQIISNKLVADTCALEAARTQAEVIFFDAAGTLFEVRGSVGEIYSRVASQYGCEADAAQLQQSFARWFRLQPPMAFAAGTDEDKLHEMEKGWWRTLVRTVFADCGSFTHFDEFFDDVFEQFRKPELWRLFDDVIPTLTELKRQGFRLGVISNFDSRLDDVLRGCELDRFFDSVHISTRVGAAKPDPVIFDAALLHHQIEASQAWHIGDSLREDFEGAEAAGIKAILLDRNNRHADNPSRITNLNQLPVIPGLAVP